MALRLTGQLIFGAKDSKYLLNPRESLHFTNESDSPSGPSADRFYCPECSKTFSRVDNLKAHSKLHDSNRKDIYSCNQCPYRFRRKYDLARHEVAHSRSRLFCCGNCHKGFSRNDVLRR